MEPIILNLETSTEICSVCLSKGNSVLAHLDAEEDFSHASGLTILIDKVLKEAGYTLNQLDAVAISGGPGSYTGLRVGTSTAKGICYALNKPLIAIDTLQSLAFAARQAVPTADYFVAMIDARRMEVYSAVYDNEFDLIEDTNAKILDKNSFCNYIVGNEAFVFCGNGVSKFEEISSLKNAQFLSLFCSSQHLVPLSFKSWIDKNFEDLAYYAPNYLKQPNITTPKKIL